MYVKYLLRFKKCRNNRKVFLRGQLDPCTIQDLSDIKVELVLHETYGVLVKR